MIARIASISAGVSLGAVAALTADFDTTFPEEPNKEALIRHVRPVLRPIYGAARVYAMCDSRSRFPRIKMQAPSRHRLGVKAIREIFARDTRTLVAVDSARVPRITVGRPSGAILQTKIHRLKFTQDQRYNIISAETAIENTPEIQAAIRGLGLKQPIIVVSENMQQPMPGVRHLPVMIRDITFDRALDLLAKTFSEVVFYQEWVDDRGDRFFFVDQGCILCLPWERLDDGPPSPN